MEENRHYYLYTGVEVRDSHLEDNRNEVIARVIYKLLQNLNKEKVLTIPVDHYDVVSKNGITRFNFEFKA